MGFKRAVRRGSFGLAFLCLGLAQSLAAIVASNSYLNLTFDNSALSSYYSGGSNVYITFGNGAAALSGAPDFDVTYTSGGVTNSVSFGSFLDTNNSTTYQNFLSSSILLTEVDDLNFQISTASSVTVFVSYGQAFSSLQAAPSVFTDGVSGNVQFQNFEITRLGGSGDQGNLTSINYFSAPMSITSYTGIAGAGGVVQQQTGFNPGQTAATVGASLAATTPVAGAGAIMGTNGVTGEAQVIRYIGPSAYGVSGADSTNAYQSLLPYVQSVAASGVTNAIVNANAFNVGSGTTGTNYNFQINYNSSVSTNGTITLSGNITTIIKDNATGISTNGPTFTDVDITINASNEADFNKVIYGQVFAPFPDVVTFGSGWTNTSTNSFFGYANTVVGQSSANTTQNLAIGDITTAILMGLLGNTNVVNGAALNTLTSEQWWRLDPMAAYSQLQSNTNYYNLYANALYLATYSGTNPYNGIYGIPYSDRLGSGPLVNSVQYINEGLTNTIDQWVIGLNDPLGAQVIPEVRGIGYLFMAAMIWFAAIAIAALKKAFVRKSVAPPQS